MDTPIQLGTQRTACASCSARVRRTLGGAEGVVKGSDDLATEHASVSALNDLAIRFDHAAPDATHARHES